MDPIEINLRLRTSLQVIAHVSKGLFQSIQSTWTFTPESQQAVEIIAMAAADIKALLASSPTVVADITIDTAEAAADAANSLFYVRKDLDLILEDAPSVHLTLSRVDDTLFHVYDPLPGLLTIIKEFPHPLVEDCTTSWLEQRPRHMHKDEQFERYQQVDRLLSLEEELRDHVNAFREQIRLLLSHPRSRYRDQIPRLLSALSHQISMGCHLIRMLDFPTLACADAAPPEVYDMKTVFSRLRQVEINRLEQLAAIIGSGPLASSRREIPVESYNCTAVFEEVWELVVAGQQSDGDLDDILPLYAGVYSEHGSAIDEESIFDKFAMKGDKSSHGEEGEELSEQQGEKEICAICVEDLIGHKEKDQTFELPCGHQFHLDCVGLWLEEGAKWHNIFGGKGCPLCRREFTFLECVLAVDVKMRDGEGQESWIADDLWV
ncbi:hypothetical protein B0T21DRAFT_408716 [Apiosordaria backusii]|uniref:RING-type domain-containing protein n=1 Tax=Apiosordaria backusii TaxID=314023 RepID=A0AA40EM60_9PEZI|nr:hypothetical protein B0T21DRAFT_408716 [Apiosordaria backusii]